MTRPTTAASMALALLLPACAGENYFSRRAMDLTDVFDVKYGTGIGLGAKVQATLYVGSGLGLSSQHTREWFGRRSIENRNELFFHLVVGGCDGAWLRYRPGQGSAYACLFNFATVGGPEPGDPPWLDWWRFGGEVYLPFVNGGLYLNFGELWDFFAGIVSEDPAGDDGMPKSTYYGSEDQ